MKRLAAVITFGENVTRERAEEIVRELEHTGEVDGSDWIDGETPIEEFESDHGSPVFYIP